jgi:hypothetical protein
MAVSGQVHAPATFPLKPKAGLDVVEKRIILHL